jgi:hypothetical protein
MKKDSREQATILLARKAPRLNSGRSMRAVKDSLSTPYSEGEESERPRSTGAVEPTAGILLRESGKRGTEAVWIIPFAHGGRTIKLCFLDVRSGGHPDHRLRTVEGNDPRNGSGSSCSIAKYEAERFFHCSAVHQSGEFINGFKWLRYIVIARFRLFQLPFLG